MFIFGTASHYCHRYCIWYTILYLVHHTVFGTAYRMNGTHTIFGTHARYVKRTIFGRMCTIYDELNVTLALVISTIYGTLVPYLFC